MDDLADRPDLSGWAGIESLRVEPWAEPGPRSIRRAPRPPRIWSARSASPAGLRAL